MSGPRYLGLRPPRSTNQRWPYTISVALPRGHHAALRKLARDVGLDITCVIRTILAIEGPLAPDVRGSDGHTAVTIDEPLLARLDERRGDVSRCAYVRRRIMAHLEASA